MQADIKTYVIFDLYRLKKIALSFAKDLIRNKSVIGTIESKILITTGDIPLSLCCRYWDRVSVAKDCQTMLIGIYPKVKDFRIQEL